VFGSRNHHGEKGGVEKMMNSTDYKILCTCNNGGIAISVRNINNKLIENGLQLNYGYLCNKCSALASVGWLLKRSLNFGRGKENERGGRPSYYLTTGKGRIVMEEYLNKRKKTANSSNTVSLANYTVNNGG
jgi:hypothetical protein